MKAFVIPGALLAAIVLSAGAGAAEPDVKEKVTVTNVVELADGGTIVVTPDGKTYHQDAKGKRVRMKDNEVMIGKDGKKYLHKNDAIWQQIVTKGTLSPNR